MNLPTHLITNTITGAIFYKIDFIHSLKIYLLFIALGVLIDLDHILFLIIKYKTLSPKKLIQAGKEYREKMRANLYIFHSPEFNLFLLMLSFFNHIFLLIFLSNLMHILLDTVEHYNFHKNFKWLKEWSVINNLIG